MDNFPVFFNIGFAGDINLCQKNYIAENSKLENQLTGKNMSYIEHLSKDKKLKKLIDSHGPQVLKKRKNLCLRLCASIMSQQLSTRVSEVIYQRFIQLFGGKEPTPEQILGINHEQLRSIGLSNSKVTYMHNVARFAIEKGMDLKKINKMDVEEIVNYLTEIKGVGRWTVEMILMFTLGKEDVFAVDDLGIQNAMEDLYRFEKADKKKHKEKMLLISETWKPYRTYACLHLWLWKDEARAKRKTIKLKKTKKS